MTINMQHQHYCRGCHQVRPLADFPPHRDANTRCIACQQAQSGYTGSSSVLRPAGLLVDKRGRKVTPREKPTKE